MPKEPFHKQSRSKSQKFYLEIPLISPISTFPGRRGLAGQGRKRNILAVIKP